MSSALSNYALEAFYISVQKRYMLACVTILYYDFLTTFDLEVERIWSRPRSLLTFLWTLNRYLPPLFYVFVVVIAHHPSINRETCSRILPLIPGIKLLSYCVIAVIVIGRTWALYTGNISVVILLATVFIITLVIQIWVASTSMEPVRLVPGTTGCLLGAKPRTGMRFLAFWISGLVFDTLLFVLTFAKSFRLRKAGPLTKTILRDGIVYFAVMFSANLMNVIIFIAAPTALKGMNAYFSHITTVAMTSHLMVNLRASLVHVSDSQKSHNARRKKMTMKLLGPTIEQLGADMITESEAGSYGKIETPTEMDGLDRSDTDWQSP